MKNAILSLLAVMALTSLVIARPTASFRDGAIHVSDGTRSFVLPEITDEYSFHETLHAIQRRGDDYYIVYGSGEWSRGTPQERGNCGGGAECYIRWLHVRGGKVVEQQEGLYLSCWKGRDGYEIGWREHLLQWSSQGWRQSETPEKPSVATILHWSYDPSSPEKGITETETIDSSFSPTAR